mgnify:CR=1 FL=1
MHWQACWICWCPVSERERLFFALWPTDELRDNLLKQTHAALNTCGGRVIPPRNLHLTLVFLGALDAAQRHCVERSADELRAEGFTLELTDLDYWRRPRVVGCRVKAIPAALSDLVDGLRSLGRVCGAKVESRPFAPHLTVMRKAQRAPQKPLVAPLAWPVREFHLVRSQTLPQGASYQRIYTWRLSEVPTTPAL